MNTILEIAERLGGNCEYPNIGLNLLSIDRKTGDTTEIKLKPYSIDGNDSTEEELALLDCIQKRLISPVKKSQFYVTKFEGTQDDGSVILTTKTYSVEEL